MGLKPPASAMLCLGKSPRRERPPLPQTCGKPESCQLASRLETCQSVIRGEDLCDEVIGRVFFIFIPRQGQNLLGFSMNAFPGCAQQLPPACLQKSQILIQYGKNFTAILTNRQHMTSLKQKPPPTPIIHELKLFAKVALTSIITLLLTIMYCKYKKLYHVVQVIFAIQLVAANHTCKIDSKMFTEDEIYYLNHPGRMSNGNKGTAAT
ncbi:hypothetical protein llap_9087 [Limosa lapponica baueri]|uniref:Uncharacterized protein n=1 Tax=Limosa lapponica baueri TaxID=1758121 RepID=A0A2I0U3H0_LIMLA|nr:hypothetical protein llap_9087 [Limosa lapponica baueri]